ncbi:MAG: hypothetical protein AAF206_03910 [Bacteroidota bacterium]
MKSFLKSFFLAVLLSVCGFGIMLMIAKAFPLPRGQGLAYVAHPIWGLAGIGLTALVYLLGVNRRPQRIWYWFAGGLLITLLWSLFVFTLL